MIIINLKAENSEVKEFINFKLSIKPASLKEPDRPKSSDIKQDTNSITELLIAKKDKFRFRKRDYKIKLIKY
jgi:hypothetical protein